MMEITRALSLVAMMAIGTQAASLEERVQALEEQNTVLTEEVLASQSSGFTLVDTENIIIGAVAHMIKMSMIQKHLSLHWYQPTDTGLNP